MRQRYRDLAPDQAIQSLIMGGNTINLGGDKMKNPEWPKHEAIYNECMKHANSAVTLNDKTCWIHLSDAVETGSISPLEAYDAFKLGYFPSYLTTRKSRYEHLIY